MSFKDIITNELKAKRPHLSQNSLKVYSSLLFNLNKKMKSFLSQLKLKIRGKTETICLDKK